MSIAMINIDLPETNTDDAVSVWLSSTTLLMVIWWFAFLGIESFYLSIIWEEYKWFCLSGLAYFLLIVRLVFMLRQMDSLFKYDKISRNKTFISYIFLILMILVLIKANLIFDQRVLILFCGFIWVPQIVHNASNGFTQNDSSFVYLISWCVLYFPLSTQLFKNNIFEFKPSTNWVKYLILLYVIQILILRLQHMLGCRFFIPRSLWKFVFKPNDFWVCDMNESNSEWAIWLNSNQNISSKSKLDKLFVHLKCGHAFHYNWLREWAKYKNKWPLCRREIFKSQSEFFKFNCLYLEY